MKLHCFWEHNGDDTLLYSVDYLGAYTRGTSLETAKAKMLNEILSFTSWSGQPVDKTNISIEVTEEKLSDLKICDADSDAIFDCEKVSMTREEYLSLKSLALKSANDFLTLYVSVPIKESSCRPERETFYGAVPRTAQEMYEHTKNVNSYYFGEIGVDCNNDGDIFSCRKRGFDLLERKADFLQNVPVEGSYGEIWSLKKVLRRFIWHDRIHAKAMYRMAVKTFGVGSIPEVFYFKNHCATNAY